MIPKFELCTMPSQQKSKGKRKRRKSKFSPNKDTVKKQKTSDIDTDTDINSVEQAQTDQSVRTVIETETNLKESDIECKSVQSESDNFLDAEDMPTWFDASLTRNKTSYKTQTGNKIQSTKSTDRTMHDQSAMDQTSADDTQSQSLLLPPPPEISGSQMTQMPQMPCMQPIILTSTPVSFNPY